MNYVNIFENIPKLYVKLKNIQNNLQFYNKLIDKVQQVLKLYTKKILDIKELQQRPNNGYQEVPYQQLQKFILQYIQNMQQSQQQLKIIENIENIYILNQYKDLLCKQKIFDNSYADVTLKQNKIIRYQAIILKTQNKVEKYTQILKTKSYQKQLLNCRKYDEYQLKLLIKQQNYKLNDYYQYINNLIKETQQKELDLDNLVNSQLSQLQQLEQELNEQIIKMNNQVQMIFCQQFVLDQNNLKQLQFNKRSLQSMQEKFYSQNISNVTSYAKTKSFELCAISPINLKNQSQTNISKYSSLNFDNQYD